MTRKKIEKESTKSKPDEDKIKSLNIILERLEKGELPTKVSLFKKNYQLLGFKAANPKLTPDINQWCSDRNYTDKSYYR